MIYPSSPAPMIGESDESPAREILPVVDQNGVVLAQASRACCHSGEKHLHPVVHLHIINHSAQVYLQQRAAKLKRFPLFWDTAVAGHISYGESVQEALFREAAEELNLHDFNPRWIDSYIFECDTERELVNIFAAVGNFNPLPNRYELNDGRYWSTEELESNLGKGVFTPSFEADYERICHSLQSLL